MSLALGTERRGPTRRSLLGGAWALLFGVRPALAAAADAERIGFADLYKSMGVRGLEFSDRLLGLRNRRVTISGFMAPPLKPETNFFVLTSEPVAICPFCSSDAEWPLDIVVIYLARAATPRSFAERLVVTGTIEVGSKIDSETGFVSQIRLLDAEFRPA